MKTFSCGCVADSDGEFDRSETCPRHLAWNDIAARVGRLKNFILDHPQLDPTDSDVDELAGDLEDLQKRALDLSVPSPDEEPDGEDKQKERETR